MKYIDGKVCCGVYYIPIGGREPETLPLLNLTAEITLYPTYSRTTFKQHFKNPSPKEDISEANYVFPLHNTQTITSFTCHVGEDKTLNGIVQSKPKAKATYDAAISRGETAGLLSWSASDVWQTKLGNIPAGASVEVVITCVAQLQHDSEKDAIRFNLPTYIASRYGVPPKDVFDGGIYSYRPGKRGPGFWQILRGVDNWVDIEGGMKINVFVDMDAPVQMVEAPAHPTNLRMGTHSLSDSSSGEFDAKKAVLSLSSDTTALDKDFVVLVKTQRSGHPSAVAQRHPAKDAVGMMLTLVPKFNLPIARPEVVFICDRSGSMGGNETQLRKALAVFLQSLPVGCKFNICSFGSSHTFLWKKSQTYSEETLKEAQAHVATFAADMGGTEMYPPIKDAVERRYKDINLELLLLTDGDVWQRDELMSYVREQCKKKTVRMFTLGIGNGVSHALIDGLASVGGGYSQVVQLQEKLDSKVVRMLRAALGQHVSNYTLEFPGGVSTAAEEDDYDMIGDAETSNKGASEKAKAPAKQPTKISLFDTSADLDPPPEYPVDNTDEARWAHLPPLPKLPERMQSPNDIPPLFPFSRTNVYVVFSPAPKALPSIARLHAKTIAGDDLELEIPILRIDDGKDVCQLAARSFLQELEDGKGYLHDGVLKAEGLTEKKQESKWDEIVEREGVRWGEGYSVASKWTSFVAVEDKTGKAQSGDNDHEVPQVQSVDLLKDRTGSLGGMMLSSASGAGFKRGAGLKRMRNSSAGASLSSIISLSQVKSKGTLDAFDTDTIGIMRENINKTTARSALLTRSLAKDEEDDLLDYSDDEDEGFSNFMGAPALRSRAAPPPPPAQAPGGAFGMQIPRPSKRPQNSAPPLLNAGVFERVYDMQRPSAKKESKSSSGEGEIDEDEEASGISLADVSAIYPAGGPPPAPSGAAFAAFAAAPLSYSPPMAAAAAAPMLVSPNPRMSSTATSTTSIFQDGSQSRAFDRSAADTAIPDLRRRSKRKSGSPPPKPIHVSTAEERIHSLIMLQSFAGNFSPSDSFAKIVEASFKSSNGVLAKVKELATKLGVTEDVVATWIAIITFRNGEGHGSEKDTWELVVDKAEDWLVGEGKLDDAMRQEIARVIEA
ncbi:hypothetical protein ABW21_db0202208 [Orbilia brochopaga]|nr:hypothetical protein ABW21_db0202208 [Drechslerella brochopaga]